MKFTTGNSFENLQLLLKDYDCFLLDFDGTLYNETDYLFAAYRKIAASLADKYPVEEREVADYLEASFTQNGRTNLFDHLCSEFDIPEKEVEPMLEILRTHHTEQPISLYPKMQWLITELVRAGKQVFVITNGNLQQQKNKTSLVAWNELDKQLVFIYATEHKPKPDKAAFDFINQNYSVNPAKTVMIGDTTTDEEFAANAGVAFIHVSAFEPLNELP